jgi:hypothetical protein
VKRRVIQIVFGAAGVSAGALSAWLLAMWVSSALQVVFVRLTPPPVAAAQAPAAGVLAETALLADNRNVFRVQRADAPTTVALAPAGGDHDGGGDDVADLADVAPDAATAPDAPQRSDLPVTLLATMVASDRARSLAFVIDHPTQGEHTLRTRQPLYDAVVVRIERTRVWVRRQGGLGALEYLALGEAGGSAYISPPPLPSITPEAPTSADAGTLAVTSAKGEIRVHEGAREQTVSVSQLLNGVDPATMIRRDAHGAYSLDLAVVQKHADAIRDMTEGMRLSVATNAEGQAFGVRIGEVAPDSLLAHLGLHGQDVIVSVNGEQPSDERAALAFLESLAHGQPAEVIVERRGRRLPLTLKTLSER